MKKKGIYQEIAQKLTELRKAKGLSQDEMAKQLGMAQSTYAGYEAANRKVPMDVLVRLADFFHVSTDFLLGKTTDFKVIESCNIFGKRVRAARYKLDMSKKDLADKILGTTKTRFLGISEKELDELERGVDLSHVTPRTLQVLATALDVETDYLLGNPDDEALQFSGYDTVGRLMRKLRKSTSHTKQAIASAIGATVLEIDDWEQDAGEMTREMKLRIFEFFGIPVEAFGRIYIGSGKKSSHALDENETDMLLAIEHLFLTLNPEGRAKLLDYAQDISTSPKYSGIEDD